MPQNKKRIMYKLRKYVSKVTVRMLLSSSCRSEEATLTITNLMGTVVEFPVTSQLVFLSRSFVLFVY